MNLIKTTIAIAMLALVAASAQAHEYRKHGNEISKVDQWDINAAAPFSRDEDDRFTQ